jgi:leader peptidase (prepilin peptidase)/N-methyltransferase
MQAYFSFYPWLAYVIVGLYGAVIGSFLNVVIYRLPIMLQKDWHKQCVDYLNLDPQAFPSSELRFNLFTPRSHCPKCQRSLKLLANIPILSYLVLGGRCGHCQQAISLRYPLIELSCSLLAIYLLWHFGWSWYFAVALLFSWLLLCMVFIDFDHQLLPDSLTLSLLWLGLLVNDWQLFCSLHDALLGAVIGYMSLWFIARLFHWTTGKEGMGHGDFKLLAALGAWLGWQMLLPIVLFSSVLGTLVGLFLIIFKGHQRNATIPFGPYLAAAGFIVFLWGKSLLGVYLQLAY